MAFAVATGRSLVEAQRILREWDLPEPSVLITSVGSEIYWKSPGGLLRDTAFDDRIVEGGARMRCSTVFPAMTC